MAVVVLELLVVEDVVVEVLVVVDEGEEKSLFEQVSGILLSSNAYGYEQCKSLNSCGQSTSSYVTTGLSHLSE